jgi:xylan 1,4-beta-xylosidase
LVWDYTYTLPDSTNNQQYFIRDLPSKSKGKLKVNIANVPAGNYALEVYKVGYRSNDAYTTYLDMGKPQQLTKQQVEQIKKQNDGSPMLKEVITVKDGVGFSKDLDIRENDVLFLNLVRL